MAVTRVPANILAGGRIGVNPPDFTRYSMIAAPHRVEERYKKP